jgi:hypothetical protein
VPPLRAGRDAVNDSFMSSGEVNDSFMTSLPWRQSRPAHLLTKIVDNFVYGTVPWTA